MKKLFISISIFLFLFVNAFSSEIQLRLMPSFGVTSKSNFKNTVGGTLSLDILPVTLRGRDDLYFSLQGNANMFLSKGIKRPYYISGDIGIGYNYRIIDRLSVALEGLVGAYLSPDYKAKIDSSQDVTYEGLSGIDFGARLLCNYYIRPSLIASAFCSYKYYYYKPPFISNVEFGFGITYNFSKGVFGESDIYIVQSEIEPIFPVFYSRYDDHSFGSFSFINKEKNDITDVSVSVFISQYMSSPKVVSQIPYVKRNESFEVELTAFLNENILNLLQNQLADAKVIVTYRSMGKFISKEEVISLQTVSRNSMTWEDDRRAAAFVSGHDGSVQLFSRQMVANLREQFSSSYPINQQYAAAVFGSLKAYGINYVVDPASAYTDNTGSSSVDFLQFPYQTLLYHGGDCDDLTILNCSLLESIGVETAFITVPGHIYMAFDAGVPVSSAGKVNGGRTIVQDGKVWIPVEITLSQDTFTLALSYGWKEWTKYKEDAVLIPLKEAWKEYSNISIPDSEISIEMPSREELIREFNNAMKGVR